MNAFRAKAGLGSPVSNDGRLVGKAGGDLVFVDRVEIEGVERLGHHLGGCCPN